jgi:putative pre-16S rRNA nuclease
VGVLAIDPGLAKHGFAVTDRLRIVLQALDSLRAGEDELLDHVGRLLAERDVSTVLVGLPLHMDGREGERARAVRGLIERLSARFPHVTVVGYDERLTTKEAESRLRELGYSGRQIATRKDSWSALVLLEDWIRSGEPR